MSELLDNRAQRIRTLKDIIRRLHEGQAPEQAKAKLKELVQVCDSTEIAQMEQELMAEGITARQIMGMCDLHAQVLSEVIAERPVPLLPPGHPVKVFQAENAALRKQTDLIQQAVSDLAAGDPADTPDRESVLRCRQLVNELMDIDKHYQRKEHLLFSMLERHGITGPSKVMWGKDDEVRALLKQLHAFVSQDDLTRGQWAQAIETVVKPALHAVNEMIFKEEQILLPMSLQTLTEVEWGEIWQQSPQFGWCLVDPEDGYRPPEPTSPPVSESAAEQVRQNGFALNIIPPAEGRTEPPKGSILFPTGALSLEQLKAIFSTLPVDITFVDADDRVRFFSEGPNRVFVRPKAVIGRKVQHCHPPGSVDTVNRILDDFRSGRQNVADFWIEYRGRFVFIRYFALRDEQGQYLGTLEVTQDLTRERSLQGERRLLQYDDAPADASA